MGQKGLGKHTFAQEVANTLVNGHMLEIVTFTPQDKQMDSLREFVSILSLKPTNGTSRVCIIDDADVLTTEAQNLLLKYIEEVPEHLYFILVSHRTRLLRTVVSRCQTYHFTRVSENTMQDFAAQQGITPSEAMLKAAFGVPGRLLTLYKDASVVTQANRLLSAVSIIQRFSLFYEYAELEPKELTEICTCALSIARQDLHNPRTVQTLQALTHAVRSFGGNFNKKLILQKLLLT